MSVMRSRYELLHLLHSGLSLSPLNLSRMPHEKDRKGVSHGTDTTRLAEHLQVNERRAEAGGIAERSPHMVVSGMSSTGISTWGRIAARLAHTYDCTRKALLVAPHPIPLPCSSP